MDSVIIVGVLDNPASTNVFQAIAFMKKDYKVVPINYRTVISKYGLDYFNGLLLHTIEKYKPYLTLFSKCNGINSDIILECNKHTKTWLWDMDFIDTIKMCPEVVTHAKNTHFSSCTSIPTVSWFKEQGVENCYHIFEGIDTNTFRPTQPVEELKADISFIGTRTELRDEYINVLKENGYDIKYYGQGYEESVVNEKFADVCASSKYMLSLNIHNNMPEYFSDRIMRYLGCRTFTFHLDNTGTLNKWFEDGKDLVYFKDIDDLLVKLKLVTDEQYNSVKENGYKKVLNNYTWDHSVEKILEIVNA